MTLGKYRGWLQFTIGKEVLLINPDRLTGIVAWYYVITSAIKRILWEVAKFGSRKVTMAA